jgi:glycerol-3-phosphate dehydrogenase (NAD(P)+)
MSDTEQAIGVIGAGAWGTALAQVMASACGGSIIWARNAGVVSEINRDHENTQYLAGCKLSPNLRATGDLEDLTQCKALLLVTPAQHLREALKALPPTNAPLLLCCKGIEIGTMDLMSEVAEEVRPGNAIAVLSGPTFAHEVAAGKPTAITLACADEALGQELAALVSTPAFRPYWSDDVVGAEIGGAVKNVLAIGCGVVDGAGLGLNARSALIARGFAEMQRYGMARGARVETLAGLSGLGDLVLTCSSENSRNFSLGRALAQGKSASELLSSRKTVAEGAYTAPVLQASARQLGVDMPIVEAVCSLLKGDADVEEVVRALLSRPLKAER